MLRRTRIAIDYLANAAMVSIRLTVELSDYSTAAGSFINNLA